MKLMFVTRLRPDRDDKTYEIIGWVGEQIALNPMNIHSVSFEHDMGKTVLHLSNRAEVLIDETVQEVQKRFEEATL